MEPSSMERALGIPDIIRNIIEFMSFDDLANARSVCKDWNKEANFWFRKRAILKSLHFFPYYPTRYGELKDLAAFLEKEASELPNQELVARIPGRVSVSPDFASSPYSRLLFLTWIRLKDSPLTRVQSLKLTWSKGYINRILPFILNKMPSLEEVQLKCCKSPSDEREAAGIQYQDFTVPADSEFSLKSLSIIMMGYDIDETFDLKFLHHCRNLKTFSCTIRFHEFLEFLETFKKLSPAFRFEQVALSLTSVSRADYDYRNIGDYLAEFLKMNQPIELSLTLPLRSATATFLDKIVRQIDRDRLARLSLTFYEGMYKEIRGEKEHMARAINSFKRFPHLRKLFINLRDGGSILKRSKEDITAGTQSSGLFLNVSELRGLTELQVTVSTSPIIEMETVVTALFHGYKPVVPLHLRIGDSRSSSVPTQKFQFSAQELQRLLDGLNAN